MHHGDVLRSVVLFSTLSPDEEEWETMKPGQMLVARRGTVIWDSGGTSNGKAKWSYHTVDFRDAASSRMTCVVGASIFLRSAVSLIF